MLTKQSTPEQAAKGLQSAWDATTDRIGSDKQAKALKTFVTAFPPGHGYAHLVAADVGE